MNKIEYYFTIVCLTISTQSFASFMSNDICADAFEVYCGTVLTADWSDATNIDDPENSTCFYPNSRRGVWYKIIGNGEILKASLCNYTTEISVFDGTCENLSCTESVTEHYYFLCEGYSTEVSFLSEMDKVYYLYCKTLNPHLGSRLTITCMNPIANNFCDNAEIIALNESYTSNNLSASLSSEGGCPNPQTYYADVWYSFIGDDSYGLLVDDCSYCSLPFEIFRGNDCTTMECVDPIHFNEGLGYFFDQGENYYLQIMTNSDDDYSFSIQNFDLLPNDSCHYAQLYIIGSDTPFELDYATHDDINCTYSYTQGIWYEFLGDGNIVSFSTSEYSSKIDIYGGTCNDLECIENTSIGAMVSILSEHNKSYFVHVYGSTSGVDTLQSEQMTVVQNNNPADAVMLSCGQQSIGTLAGATSNYSITNTENPGVWYSLVGTDEFYTVSTEFLETTYYEPKIKIYDDNFNDTYYYNNSIFLDDGRTYFIHVHHNVVIDSFRLEIQCLPIAMNDVCATSIEIQLLDTITGTTLLSNINTDEDCGYNNTNRSDVWFYFKGDGKLKDLFFTQGRHSMSVFSGNCSDLFCEESGFNRPYWNLEDSIRFFFELDKDYYFKVFNYNSNSESEDFQFWAKDLLIAENDLCHNAKQVSCQDIVIDSTDFAVSDFSVCDMTSPNNGVIWYSFEGAGKYVEIKNISEEFDFGYSYQLQLFTGLCSNLVCLNNEIVEVDRSHVFYAEAGVDYYFSVGRYAGVFQFEITCLESLENNNFENATDIVCGENYSGYEFFDDAEEDIVLCPYSDSEIPNIWFTITGNNEFVYVYQNNSDFSSCSIYTLVNNQMTCFDRISENRIYLPAGQDYYFRFCNYGHNGNSRYYDISFECHPKVENDDCVTALVMQCGEIVYIDRLHATDDDQDYSCGGSPEDRAIWFTVQGDNSWKHFEFKDSLGQEVDFQDWSYEGSCSNLECLVFDNVFFAESGKDYFLAVSRGYYIGLTEISMTCHETVENDLCTEALQVMCGDTINSTFDYAMLCDDEDPCTYGNNLEKKVWFSILGTGNFMNVQFNSEAYNDHTIELEIYSDGCCILNQLISQYGNDQNNIYFQTEENIEYLISASLGAVWDNGDYQMIVECVDQNQFNTCENAQTLADQQTVIMNLELGLNFLPNDDFHYDDPLSWVKFQGSGFVDTIVVTSQNANNLSLYFYLDKDQNCSLLGQLQQSSKLIYSQTDSVVYVISTNTNFTYAVGIKESHHYSVVNEEVSVTKYNGSFVFDECEIMIDPIVYADEQQEGIIFIDIDESFGPYIVQIPEYNYGNWFNIEEDQLITFRTSDFGIKVLDYRSNSFAGDSSNHTSNHSCAGQLIFDFIKGPVDNENNAKIIGPSNLCLNMEEVSFYIEEKQDVEEYVWTYSNNGIHISSTGSNIISATLATVHTHGILSVDLYSDCGSLMESYSHEIYFYDDEFCNLSSCETDYLMIYPENLNLLGPIDVYRANREIESNIIFDNNAVKVFRAGEQINLMNGFEVKSGVEFTAEILPCGN